MPASNGNQMFPCPVCTTPRGVRITKKKKPYITCDPCGIQLFVRGPAGVAAFDRLVERGNSEGLWTRIAEMERRFHPKCPKCGAQFWIEPELVKTSSWDGSLTGFKCPRKDCGGIAQWPKKQ